MADADETARIGYLGFLEVITRHEEEAVILLMGAIQDPGTKGAVEKFGCAMTVAQATSLVQRVRAAIQELEGPSGGSIP